MHNIGDEFTKQKEANALRYILTTANIEQNLKKHLEQMTVAIVILYIYSYFLEGGASANIKLVRQLRI